MIDTLIFLLVLLPLSVTLVWYTLEMYEINLHKREMEQLWDLYAEESTLPGSDEPIKDLSTSRHKNFIPYKEPDPSIPYKD